MAKKPKFNETVSLQKFRANCDFLNTHIQLIDSSLVLSIRTLRKETDKEKDINKALKMDEEKYNHLNHPVKQHNAIFRHTQNKNIQFALIQLYDYFSSYLRSIVKEMYEKKPLFIAQKAVLNKNGEDKENLTLKFAEIIRLGDYSSIENEIVNRIFRSIEELKSTKKLLDRILSDTKVNISNGDKEDALKYLEFRHLLTHNKGLIDNKYACSYGKKFTPNLNDGNKIPTRFNIFKDALNAVSGLCLKIDQELIRTGFVDERQIKN